MWPTNPEERHGHELTARPIDTVYRLSNKKFNMLSTEETGSGLAVDIKQKMLDYNKQELDKLGIVNWARSILGKPDDPSPDENSVDLHFLCNAYHHVKNHVDYWAKIKSALKPDGRVVIVDFYHDERSGKLGSNMKKAGLAFSKEHTFLSRQYFLEFVESN